VIDASYPDATIVATYQTNLNLDMGLGTTNVIPVVTGTIPIVDNKAVLTAGDFLTYAIDPSTNGAQGCIRFYMTTTTTYVGAVFLRLYNGVDDHDQITLNQNLSGSMYFTCEDSSGAECNNTTGYVQAYPFIAGLEYEIEVNWNFSAPFFYLYINGYRLAVRPYIAGTRAGVNILQIAGGTNQYAIRGLTLFNNIQHSEARYDAGYYPMPKITTIGNLETTNTRIALSDTTASISSLGGAYLGKNLIVASTTQATDTSTGAVIVSGGLGLNGNMYMNGTFDTTGPTFCASSSGSIELKNHLAKIDDTHISVEQGSGYVIYNNARVKVTWATNANYDVSSIGANGRAWIYIDNTGSIQKSTNYPVSLNDYISRIILGRIWDVAGTLNVAGTYLSLAYDPSVSLMEVWRYPAWNSPRDPVTFYVATSNTIHVGSGELFRFPTLSNLSAFPSISHMWSHLGHEISTAWYHLASVPNYVVATKGNANPALDVSKLCNYYDTGATTPTEMSVNYYAVHRLGVFAGSNAVTFIVSQEQYSNKALAIDALRTFSPSLQTWVIDGLQLSKICYIICKRDPTGYWNSGDVTITNWSGDLV
jgi:hypothetical protein